MGTDLNYLPATVISGPNADSKVESGITIYLPVNADSIAPIKFQIPLWKLGLVYTSATDKVFLEASNEAGSTFGANSFSYELTRVGDLFEYSPDSTHWGASGIQPGSSRDFDCRLVYQRDSGAGVYVREQSKMFDLTVKRVGEFSLNELAGLQAWYSAWDLGDNSDGDVVATWMDRSDYNKDLYEATNGPTFKYDNLGRPCLRFDGTNDKLTSVISDNVLQAGKFSVPCTFLMVARQRIIPSSATIIARLGSTVPMDLKVINSGSAGLTAVNTATSTSAVTLEDNKVFVGGFTKASGGAITAYHNVTAGSGAGTAAVTSDVLILGSDGASAFAGVDVMEVAIFNTVLSSTNLDRCQRTMASRWGVNL